MTGLEKSMENGSESFRDAIRDGETEAFERLRSELAGAFDAPDEAYSPLDADTVIRRNA